MGNLLDRAVGVNGTYWNRTLEEKIRFSPLESKKTLNYDIIVIGGGPSGISASYTLRDFGADVLLLEGRDIGFSVGNSMGIIDGITGEHSFAEILRKKDEATKQVFWNNKTAFEQLNRIIDEHDIKCERMIDGQVYFFKEPDKLFHSSITALLKLEFVHGEDFSILDAGDVKNYMQNSYFKCGIWLKYGMMINPLSFVKGFARVAKEKGVEICENSQVMAIVKKKDSAEVITPGAKASAKKIIIATNPYTIDLIGVPETVRNKIVPIFQTVAVSNSIPSELINCRLGWVESGDDYPGLTYPFGRVHILNGESRILLGTGGIQPVYFSKPKMNIKRSNELFKTMFPGKDIFTEEIFGGIIGQTPDGEGLEGFISENIFLGKVDDGINLAVDNGRRSAKNVLGLEKTKQSPYRNGPTFNTLYEKIPAVLKDPAARIYLALVSLRS